MIRRTVTFVDVTELTAGIVPDAFFQAMTDIAPFQFGNGLSLVSLDVFMEHVIASDCLTEQETRWLQNRCNHVELNRVRFVDMAA
jgi:hypothetical protein